MERKDYHAILAQDKKRSPYVYANYLCYILNPAKIDYKIWDFQKTLRLAEFYASKRKNFFEKIINFIILKKYNRLSTLLGFTIPLGVFGPGLHIVHRGTIVVNGNAQIGNNCTINVGVNIGTQAGFDDKCPKIGNNVYIGPGAKLYGDIYIADNCAIGANAVVNKSCFEPYTIIAGIPAKPIGKVSRQLS